MLENDNKKSGYLKALLLAMCIGVANAARGSGLKNTKPVVLVIMGIACFTITNVWWVSALFPLPLLVFWWIGTGEAMAFLLNGADGKWWRVWEWGIPFVYSVIVLSILWRFL